MPDLTIEIMQQCSDLEYHTLKIGDYLLTFDPHISHPDDISLWSCTCKGFKYRKTCKHIEQAEKNQCQWHQMYDVAQTKKQSDSMECPLCGKNTMLIQVAV